MTVWIVNPFDNLPLEGFPAGRYWRMAEAFVAAGHRVTYWTADFSHTTKRPRVTVDSSRWPDGYPSSAAGSLEVALVPTLPYAKNLSFRRIVSHVRLANSWLLAALARDAKPDLVIASVPPLRLATNAMRYARKVKAKFIVDIQDAWPETFYRVVPRWLCAPLKAMARRLYRGADAVTAVAESYIALARADGAKGPFHVARLSA